MTIKAASREVIVNAMQVFDTGLRGQSEWQAWEQNQAHLYAIDVTGTLYPATRITDWQLRTWHLPQLPGRFSALAGR